MLVRVTGRNGGNLGVKAEGFDPSAALLRLDAAEQSRNVKTSHFFALNTSLGHWSPKYIKICALLIFTVKSNGGRVRCDTFPTVE